MVCTLEIEPEYGSLSDHAFNFKSLPVRLQNVFYDGQSKPGTALFPGAGFVDPEKTFGNPAYVFWFNTNPGVADADPRGDP